MVSVDAPVCEYLSKLPDGVYRKRTHVGQYASDGSASHNEVSRHCKEMQDIVPTHSGQYIQNNKHYQYNEPTHTGQYTHHQPVQNTHSLQAPSNQISLPVSQSSLPFTHGHHPNQVQPYQGRQNSQAGLQEYPSYSTPGQYRQFRAFDTGVTTVLHGDPAVTEEARIWTEKQEALQMRREKRGEA